MGKITAVGGSDSWRVGDNKPTSHEDIFGAWDS